MVSFIIEEVGVKNLFVSSALQQVRVHLSSIVLIDCFQEEKILVSSARK